MKILSSQYSIKNNVINFVATGPLGDFIHQLYAVKNICKKHSVKANIYLNGYFKFGADVAYQDLIDIVIAQDYVNKFEIYSDTSFDYIDLDEEWRGYAYAHCPNGNYMYCWSELMANTFNFRVPGDGMWIHSDNFNKDTEGKILINYGGSNPEFNKILEDVIYNNKGNVLFITCNEDEYRYSTYMDIVPLYFFTTINHLVKALKSCKMYIGYQSAPFAVACSLDINRLVVLRDATHLGFYAGEKKYSTNISYYLNDKNKFKSINSIIEI